MNKPFTPERPAFPWRAFCVDNYGWANCPTLAKMVWMRLRLDPNKVPAKLTWYAVDMEVLSPESIKLFVYEIADSLHGGIGERIFETVVTEFTDKEKEELDKVVLSIYTGLAEEELERREQRQRELQIMNIRKELFGV
jgi:hypothetical protein